MVNLSTDKPIFVLDLEESLSSINKKISQFWREFRRQRESIQGPLGPTNLESSVLLTELSQLVKSWGSNRKYILQFKYYVVLGMVYKARF